MDRTDVLNLYVYRNDGSLNVEETQASFNRIIDEMQSAFRTNLEADLAVLKMEATKLPQAIRDVFFRYHPEGNVRMPIYSLVHETYLPLYGTMFPSIHLDQTYRRIQSFIRNCDFLVREPDSDEVYTLKQ